MIGASAEKMMTTSRPSTGKSTLEQIVDDLFAAYPDDPSSPGVTIAKIKETPRPRYYVSVVRYERPLGEGRRVVVSWRAENLALAIREVARLWREHVAKKEPEGGA